MSFTEDEFLKVLRNNWQSQMNIGALITLSNQYCSTYEVIGVNHDGTTDTVDIMAHTQVANQQFSASSSAYSSSNVRTWINNTYFNAFSENIRNAAKTMAVITGANDSYYTTNDKVKLLSMVEIGVTDPGGYITGEGSLYTGVFTPNSRNTATADRWRGPGTSGSDFYWLRSMSSSSKVWGVLQAGNCGSLQNTYTYGVLPVLRF